MKKILIALALVCGLSACVAKQGQDVYKPGEVGVSRAVEFGTVIGVRQVKIAADNKGTGALLGGGTGAGLGSYGGDGSGSAWAAVGGAIAGAVIGNAIEEEVGSSEGYEYTLEMRDGDIKTIVQEAIEGDRVFKAGDKVMLQYCDAGKHNSKCKPEKWKSKDFQRLLPVDKFPAKSKTTKSKSKRSKRDTHDDYEVEPQEQN